MGRANIPHNGAWYSARAYVPSASSPPPGRSSTFGATLAEHAAPLRRGDTTLVKIYFFQEATAALGHARQRFLGDLHRHTRLLAQPLVEMPEECSATCEDHPPVHDVRT